MSTDQDLATRFGNVLRQWRASAGLSQSGLAKKAECSPRHLSFVENGRSRASRDLVLRLGEGLGANAHDIDRLLRLAGYAGEETRAEEANANLSLLLRFTDRVLTGVDPNPAAILDERSRIIRMNRIAAEVFSRCADLAEVWDDGAFSFLLGSFHPDGMRAIAEDWEPYGEGLLQALARDRFARGPEYEMLMRRIHAFPGVDPEWSRPRSDAKAAQLFSLTLKLRGRRLRIAIPSLVMTPPGSTPGPVYPERRLSIALAEDSESERALRDIRDEIRNEAPPRAFAPFMVG